MKKANTVEGFDSLSDNKTRNDVPKKASKKASGGFQSFGLSPSVVKGIQKRGYKLPTPIQRKSIPIILEGRDVVAMARTGSGKTACFLIPLFEKLLKQSQNSSTKVAKGIRSLILSPTRELALQTLRFIRDLGKFTGIKAVALLGGDSMDDQFGKLHENPDVVVATPGRFLHLCVEMDLKLHSVEYVVFDEADRLFEMGFGEQITEIVHRLPDSGARQTVLFSATLPKLLVNFARAGLNDPALLRLDVETKLPDTLSLAFLPVRTDDKVAALLALLHSLPDSQRVVVFCATRYHCEYVHMLLDKDGISNTLIYSDLDPSARKINAAKFQNGNVSVLLVTDVAARGVDIPHLDYVINFHFPAKAKLFVHRVGRCARAGRSGTAFSFVSPEEMPFVIDLHLFLGQPLTFLTKKTAESKCCFGHIPSVNLEAEQSRIIEWHSTNAELESMKKVCSNGYGKYLRSRPVASSESAKRSKELDFSSLTTHPVFDSEESNAIAAKTLLDQMKHYKPKGTIFEVNVSAKSKGYGIMKTAKKIHARFIENFKTNKKVRNSQMMQNESEEVKKLEPGSENNFSETFLSSIVKNRKRPFNVETEDYQDGKKKKKRKSFIDTQHYIPHVAPDRHTEEGLAINNFSMEAEKIAFDMTADTDEGLRIVKNLKKWDKKKKKMVGVESEKAGKIKTEAGIWISKTYKSNRYAQWKEHSRMAETMDESEDEEEAAEKSNRMPRKNIPNTHWARHNRKLAEKEKKKSGLRRPEQIAKARKEKHQKQFKSLPKNKRGKKKKAGGGRRK